MARPRICLHGLGPELQDRVWESHQVLRIGRSPAFEVSLSDASISRCHAEIVHTPNGWTIRDLGSTNGTFLNGIRVGQVQRKILERDVLQFGNVVMLVAALVDHVDYRCETPVGNLQVRGTAKHSWQESLELMALDVTRRSRPGDQLVALLRVGHLLCDAGSIEELFSLSLRNAAQLLNAEQAALLLPDELSGKLTVRAKHSLLDDAEVGPVFSVTLAQRCLYRGESLLCADTRQDPELLDAPSVIQGEMNSLICALLRTPRRALGVMQLGRRADEKSFTFEDLHFADALAAGLSASIAGAMQIQERQRNVFIQTVIALVQALELRDGYTSRHNQRVTDFALLLADEMHLSPAERLCLQIAGPLHDIGKVGLDDAILRKPEPLSPEEYETVKTHSLKGAALVGTIPDLASVAPVIRAHHERWDGTGYPDGLAGEAIPKLSRIIAVADAFDVLTSSTPYRPSGPLPQALAQISSGMGTQFDPDCAQAFVRLQPRLEQFMQPQTEQVEAKSTVSELVPYV